ncbi:MAG TPA: CorA family divalent cation transporter [Acidimicrobiia bacterium]|nr:CorA family divalent cation transporter [Acidimicrobiia bacterium]
MTSTDPETRRGMPADGIASRATKPAEPGSRLWLYSGDGEDAPVRLDTELPDLGKNQMLWADVDLEVADDLDQLWKNLEIEDLIAGLGKLEEGPALVQHNGILQLAVTVLLDEFELEPMTLHCLVGPNWVVTLHRGELDLVDEFNKPFHGETRLGDLDGPAFLSLVLDWQVSGYFKIIEGLQGDIDHLDEDLLSKSPEEGSFLDRLQEFRRRVRTLRNTLSAHREVLGLLSHPRSDAVVGAEATEDYQRLEDRLQQAIEAVDTTREMIVGSFDIFMTRTAQTTNDIMKRLTIVSVLLLPTAAIAGIMGMNFKIGIFERPWMFWVTLGLMAVVAGITLLVAKRNDWL